MKNVTLGILITVLFVFIGIGALIFQSLEAEYERIRRDEMKNLKSEFLCM